MNIRYDGNSHSNLRIDCEIYEKFRKNQREHSFLEWGDEFCILETEKQGVC